VDINETINEAIDTQAFYEEYLDDIVYNSAGQVTENVACPFHEDKTPSLRIYDDGNGVCYGCDKKWASPIGFYQHWMSRDGKKVSFLGAQRKLYSRYVRPIVPGGAGRVKEFHTNLLKNPKLVKHLNDRAIPVTAIKQFEIGYDNEDERYTVPILNSEGWVVDIRKIKSGGKKVKVKNYQYDYPTAKAKKERGERTFGKGGRVFPYVTLEEQTVILCEGEFDCVVLNTNGFKAVTTGGTHGWKKHYELLRNKDVIICMDSDDAGRASTETLLRELYEVCTTVCSVSLPDGMDVTDYFTSAHDKTHFQKLLDAVTPQKPVVEVVEKSFEVISLKTIEDIHRSRNFGKRGVINARLVAEKDQRYSIPLKYTFHCPSDRGKPCMSCPMLERGGEWFMSIDKGSSQFLECVGATDRSITADFVAREGISASCKKLSMEVNEVTSVRMGKIAPPVVRKATNRDKNHQEIITTCGELELNADYALEGSITKDPKTQTTLFVVDKARLLQTTFRDFTPPEAKRTKDLKSKFNPKEMTVKSILKKHAEINELLSHNVTFIYGREELHTAVDMTFHSPLQLNFEGKVINSYMETVILGDTNTGKNAVLDSMCEYYKAGLVVDSASTTRAGLLGAFDEKGYFGWGVYVQQHGKLIGMDEGTNLAETIGTLRSIREGKADYFKAGGSMQTVCMARAVILANDPGGSLSTNAYPVLALPALFDQAADISRFSMACFLRGEDTPISVVNESKPPKIKTEIKQEDFQEVLSIAWSLTHKDIKFTPEAKEAIYSEATRMSKKYCSKVALVQSSVQRNKIASWSSSLACRQFNFDGSNIVVTAEYVKAAVKIVEKHYDSEACQYNTYSMQEDLKSTIADEKAVIAGLFDKEQVELGSADLSTCYRNFLSTKIIDYDYLGNNLLHLGSDSAVRLASKLLVINRCLEKEGSKYYTKTRAFVKLLKKLLDNEEKKAYGSRK